MLPIKIFAKTTLLKRQISSLPAATVVVVVVVVLIVVVIVVAIVVVIGVVAIVVAIVVITAVDTVVFVVVEIASVGTVVTLLGIANMGTTTAVMRTPSRIRLSIVNDEQTRVHLLQTVLKYVSKQLSK